MKGGVFVRGLRGGMVMVGVGTVGHEIVYLWLLLIVVLWGEETA